MNQAGRDALRAAGLSGVVQITGRAADDRGGLCAIGVLANARSRGRAWAQSVERAFDLCINDERTCPLCPIVLHEYGLVSHLNDNHGCDFFKIAELMPVTDAP